MFLQKWKQVALEQGFQQTLALFSDLNNESSYRKKGYISELIKSPLIDIPTQALVHSLLIMEEDYLENIVKRASHIKPKQIIPTPHGVQGFCHTVSAYLKVLHPELILMTGIADGWYHHSWLYNKERNLIVEPTPMIRDSYYGYEVQDLKLFTAIEHEDVLQLIRKGDLPADYTMAYSRGYSAIQTSQ